MWVGGCLLALWAFGVVALVALLAFSLVVELPWLLLAVVPFVLWRRLRSRSPKHARPERAAPGRE